jgi:sigma-B regulation protein RsbU (phosphoserine phosphatase)
MMTLRARLVLWLLLMSVVPLGAVTVYSYVNSANALREAAAREADLMAGELSSRMQLVTAELSNRVEKLMAMQEAEALAEANRVAQQRATAPAPSAAAPEVPVATAPAPADIGTAIANAAVGAIGDVDAAKALGDAALLLNSVELQGMGNFFRRNGGRRSGGRGDVPIDEKNAASQTGQTGQPGRAGSRQTRPGDAKLQPPTTGAPDQPVPPNPPTPVPAPDKVVIDVGAIARDMTKRLAPEGLDKLSPEDRQRVNREIGSRIMGITEGLRMGAEELQRRAEEAKEKASATAPAAVAAPAAPAPAPTKPAQPAQPAQPTKTRTTLSGNRLGVTVERGGEVVHQANAEVNLDNLLMTVFTTTHHDQGEVPFAVAKDGKIYAQTPADRETVAGFGDLIKPDAPLGTHQARDYIVVTNTDPSGSGLRFGIARPVGDSISALRRTAGRNAGLGLLFIGLALVIVLPVSQTLTRNLNNLTDATARIATGDFSARVPVQGSRDVAALATAFNRMAEDLQGQQEQLLVQERLKRELELGRQIQSEMLPHESLRLGLTEIKGMSIPAREVGGDFFNYFALDDGTVALLVGDVSGKGVGAALVMANFQATLRTRLTLGHDLAAIADAIDRDMGANSPRGLYATLFVGILDPQSKRLRYVNAGHNPQFAFRAGEHARLDRLESTGTPIGLLPGRGYTQREIQLAAGDFLYFYTDGVVEAEDERGEMFGPERLEQLLVEAITPGSPDPDAVLQQVESKVRAFRGKREPFDDATSMVVRVG